MGLLQRLVSGYLLSRVLNRGRRRRGYGRSPYMARRPRGRGQVHVTGCCLPIPCGAVVGLSAVTAGALHRLRK